MLGLWLALAINASPEQAQITLDAELLLHDSKTELSTAEGHARLRGDDAAVNADRIAYDKHRRVATASGHVVARLAKNGYVLVLADVVTIRFDDANEVQEIYLYDGETLSKTNVGRDAFLAAETGEIAKKIGTTQSKLDGNHLVREGTGWTIEALELVPCECDFENPAWSISSSRATVYSEEQRVSVSNPIIRIKNVPVLWLPWLSLPLNDRQTGLLFPKPGFSPQQYGFALEEPVFITLGRSADLTLTPGFFTGGRNFRAAGPLDKGTVEELSGLAGPRLNTEFRYAPSRNAAGRINLGLIYDLHPQHDVETWWRKKEGTQRGLRGELSIQHLQDFGGGFGTRVDLNGHSDGDYNRDVTVDVIASATTYLRSSATLFHRGSDHALTLDVGLKQDIQYGYDVLGRANLVDPLLHPGLGPYGPGTLQRLPALSFGWSPATPSAVRFSLEGEAVRLSPLFSNTGDEGVTADEGRSHPESFVDAVNTRLFRTGNPFIPAAPGTGDRIWQVGEREARDRVMVMPRLSIAGQPFGFLTSQLSVGWRQLAWAGEASGRLATRGYLVAGGVLETQIARSFGSIRHVIQPRAELRAIPFGFEASTDGQTIVPYDAIDAAVPDVRTRVQGALELRQRLLSRDNTEFLRLDLGQGFELLPAKGPTTDMTSSIGESWIRLGSRVGWFSAQGVLRLDPVGRYTELVKGTPTEKPVGITRVGGRVDFNDGKGHGLYGSYENVMMEGTARSRQPIDLLFNLDRTFTSVTRTDQLSCGASWNFGPASLRYDILLARQGVFGPDGITVDPSLDATLSPQQHMLAVGLSPACDCWKVELYVTQLLHPIKVPTFGFSVTVARFGSIGMR